MSKMLFLSNGIKPSQEDYEYIGEEKLTNFSIPSIKAADQMGLQVTVGINRLHAEQMTCQYPVSFYNAEIYRNPFRIKEVIRAYKNACAELRKGDYKIIHCNTPIGGVIGRLAGKKCGISKIVYTAHGFHFYKGAPKKNWLLYYSIEKWLARHTDALITINQEDYELAKTKLKLRRNGKVYYVPGVGIDTTQYNPSAKIREEKRIELGIPRDAFLVISAGELNANKNNGVIISAMEKLQNKNVHYILCGAGEKQVALQTQADKAGLHDKVHFLGYRNDVKELYQAADCFVMPSFREGLSRSIMEAMASGLPCVVSKIRGNVDLIEDGKGGYLCPSTDADCFAEAINKIAEDTSLREEMRTYNLNRIKDFDSCVVEKELQDIFREVLETEKELEHHS